MRKFFLSTFVFLAFLIAGTFQAQASKEATVYFFWGDGCPHCAVEKPFLEKITQKHPGLEVKSFETWKNQNNAEIFQKVAKTYNIQARGVPTTFIGDFEPIVGFNKSMESSIENKITHCLEQGCPDPGEKAGLTDKEITQAEIISGREGEASSQLKTSQEEQAVCVHLFYQENNCAQCNNIESYLESIKDKQAVDVKKHNVGSEAEEKIYQSFKKKYGLTTGAFPIAFIGEKYFVGDDAIQKNLEKEISRCQEENCPCPAENTRGFTPYLPQSENVTPEKQGPITIPFFGQINLSNFSAYVTTAIVAFVDGFNPCSLWLITFLLGIVIHSNSRKKIAVVGGTFLIVTGVVYALFMAGLLNIFLYVGYMNWIQAVVAGIALIFAIVNIKDYFWYKKGISFTISDKHKPKIFKNIRGVMNPHNSLFATIIGTTILAMGVVLVELPCTSGFPLIWTNMIAQQGIHGSTFLILLGIYMLIYLLDELIVIGGVFWTMRKTRFEEKHGRILKLIGGMIMLALALVMIINPDLMNEISSAILIFLTAIAASFLVMWLHRKILPRFGVHIGTEKTLSESDSKNEKNNK